MAQLRQLSGLTNTTEQEGESSIEHDYTYRGTSSGRSGGVGEGVGRCCREVVRLSEKQV